MDSKTTVIIKTTICFRLHHLRAFVLSRVCDLTQPHKTPRSIPGTGRERLPIDGGMDGAVAALANWLEMESFTNGTFESTPEMDINTWRDAQLFLCGETLEHMRTMTIRVHNEGFRDREVIIIPSMSTVKKASEGPDPAKEIDNAMKTFSRVYTHGLTRASLKAEPSELGFDKVMGILGSCYALFELPEPEPEIKYQCTCEGFWHYYKCRHSVGLSIRNKGVQVPAIYNVTRIGAARKRGRPRKARGGEALVVN